MDDRKPRPAIGTKFHADGTFRTFRGNSVVCPIDLDAPQVELLRGVQRRSREQPFGPLLAQLPPESFHMTAFDLVCEQVREPAKWTSELPLDEPLEQADAWMAEQLRPLRLWAADLTVRFERIGPIHTTLHAVVVPADAATRDALSAFREAAAEATGVRHPNHDHYAFHVSLAYLLYEMTDDEQRAFDRFATGEAERLRGSFGELRLGFPELVFFDTMAEFPTVRT